MLLANTLPTERTRTFRFVTFRATTMFTFSDGSTLTVYAPSQEASQPLLSADQFQVIHNLPQIVADIESQRVATNPSVVVVNMAPNASLVGVHENVDGMELLRMERAVLLVPVSIVAHASISYSVVKYLLSVHQNHSTIRLIFTVYMAASLVISFILPLYLRCHTPQVRSQLCAVLCRNDFVPWTLFLFTQVSLGLVISTFAVFGFSTKLLFLTCGLSLSLLASVCGLAHNPLVIPRPGFLSDHALLKEYTGMFFPYLLFLFPIEFLYLGHKLPRAEITRMVLGVLLTLLGATWCSAECTKWGNSSITYFFLIMTVVIAMTVRA